MGFDLNISVPALTVFLQGLLSFFSPCVLPLLPLYIGYLSGGTGKRGEDGKMHYNRKKVLVHTLCFVLGVSFTFFLMGLGVSALGQFFRSNQLLFARGGGIIVFMFGLYQMGLFGTSEVLGQERRLPFRLNVLTMSPVTALIMGFTFSFAWTPCVGPALTSVLLMAASAKTQGAAFLLSGVYTAGFVLPFLAVGFFTTTLLEMFKKHGNIVRYTVKAGAVLMILMGLMMFTGRMNSITGYLSGISLPGGGAASESKAGENDPGETGEPVTAGAEPGTGSESESAPESGSAAGPESDAEEDSTEEGRKIPVLPAIEFTLTDQYGNTHTMSDYKGKTVFLNFWATWCPPCRMEMPDIQKLYEEYQEAEDESVVILGVAAPNFGQEGSEEHIRDFLEKNGYTYPVVMDTDHELFSAYGIYSYPTTFMIDSNGNVFGYVAGMLTEDMMRDIIAQTVEGKRR